MYHQHDSLSYGGKLFSRLQVPPELYDRTIFAKWSHEGKEAVLLTVQLDICNHKIKLSSLKEDFAIDVRQLKVLLHPYTSKFTCDFSLFSCFHINCTQLVLIGNHPRESSKIKKLFNKSEEVRG